MPIVDTAIYREGVRELRAIDLDRTFDQLREHGGFAWIGLYQPTEDEFMAVAEEFGLHPLAVEDALQGHQRPKLERYHETLFVVLLPARYLDVPEQVEFGEVHLFVGPNFVVTVRHAQSPDLGRVRERLEARPELLALGPEAVLYGVLDDVVDEYQPVIAGLENDIDEIEDELFGTEAAVSRRVYELVRETIAFQRATQPLIEMLTALEAAFEEHGVHVELQRNLHDVLDHAIKTVERADSFRVLLQNALTVQSTLVTQIQNDEMRRLSATSLEQGEQVKRISSWAAILFAPTLVAAIYGMNFRHMPELTQPWGYPFALGLMLASVGGLYAVFKRSGWL